jgi:hypothetical protein
MISIISDKGTVRWVGREKYSNKYGFYRWVKILSLSGITTYLIPIKPDKVILTGDIVEFECTNKWVSKDGTVFLSNILSFNVISHEVEQRKEIFNLTQIKFYDSGIVMIKDVNDGKVGRIKASINKDDWLKFQPDLEPSYRHNRIKNKLPIDEQKESFIEIEGIWKVFYRLDGSKSYYLHSNMNITRHNISKLVKIIADSEIMRKWREVRKEIRELLDQKRVVMAQDIKPILIKHGFKDNPDEVLKNMTWKGDYDEEFFGYLKSLTIKPIGFTDRGYWFEIDGPITIWEVPVYGEATYLFRGSMEEVVAKLGDLSKKDLLYAKKDIDPEKFDNFVLEVASTFFIGRCIHTELDSWKERISKMISSLG